MSTVQLKRKSEMVIEDIGAEVTGSAGNEYPLMPPFARASIGMHDGKLTYTLIEPDLKEYKPMLDKLETVLTKRIEYSIDAVENPDGYLRKEMDKAMREHRMAASEERKKEIFYYLKNKFLGLGPIEPLLKDPNIEDISCNGSNVPLFIRHKTLGSIPSNISFGDEELEMFVMKIAQKCNRFISYAQPLLDGSLPDGSRVQATFSGGVSVRGPNFTIRKFKNIPFSPLDLARLNTMNPKLMAYFWEAIENGMSILVSGGTATGKTSFLNAIALFIPPTLKVVSIEDTPEINIPHDNWIQSVSRAGYGAQKYGEVSMFDLLKASFRQRPDYIILGEVRGQEAYVLFQSMASGHPGLGTIHAESVDAIIERLLSPPISLSPALLELLDIAVIIVFSGKHGPNARRVKEVIEIQRVMPDGTSRTNTSFRWLPVDDTFEYVGRSNVVSKIARLRGKTDDAVWKEIYEKEEILEKMMKKAHNYREFFDLMSLYYNKKDSFMKKLG